VSTCRSAVTPEAGGRHYDALPSSCETGLDFNPALEAFSYRLLDPQDAGPSNHLRRPFGQGNRMRTSAAVGLLVAIALAVLIWPPQLASAQGRKPVTDAMREQCRTQIRAAGLSGRFRPASQRSKRQVLFLNCLAKLRKQ
jgi:hypothetical protein